MTEDNLENTDGQAPPLIPPLSTGRDEQGSGFLDKVSGWIDKVDGLKTKIGGLVLGLGTGLDKVGVHGDVVTWMINIGLALTLYGGGDWLRKAAPDSVPLSKKTGNTEWDWKLKNQNK